MRLRRRRGGESGDPVAAAEDMPEESAEEQEAETPNRGRLRRFFSPPKTHRGLLVLLVLFGAGAAMGGIEVNRYTETAGFCGRCHTMGPELKAYKMSPHREVPCADCHTAPGVVGFIKAKIAGTRQVIEIVTGTFPEPIPTPNHSALPPVKDTCLKCHSLASITENGGPVQLILRPRYTEDKTNTRQMIALVVRPHGFGQATITRGVHWHVQEDVVYATPDEHSLRIPWVGVTFRDGRTAQYVEQSVVKVAENAQDDIDRLKKSKSITLRRMDCLNCHNRAGHAISSVPRSIDNAIADGQISQRIPYIKRDGVNLLEAEYPSVTAADRAIAGLRTKIKAQYPLVYAMQKKQVDEAITTLQGIYRLVATPEMKVTAQTYPNYLGHQSSPGCFRCHDGAHYRIVNGRLTDETIPSSCATCHTFPQVGSTVANLPFVGAPKNHKDKLWVFSHKARVASADPAGTSCGMCHTRSWCEDCHKSGAIKVSHDEMKYNHAKLIRESGINGCVYCHQPASCMRCHKGNPLKGTPQS
jgi:hypothetical protein